MNLERKKVVKKVGVMGWVQQSMAGVFELVRINIFYTPLPQLSFSGWLILLFFIGVVGVGVLYDNDVDRAKRSTLSSLSESSGYLQLSKQAAMYGDFEASRKILLSGSVMVGEVERISQVLGESDELSELLAPEDKLKKQLASWNELVKQHPSYLTGHLELVVLNWKLRNDKEVNTHLDAARKINPNDKSVLEVVELLAGKPGLK